MKYKKIKCILAILKFEPRRCQKYFPRATLIKIQILHGIIINDKTNITFGGGGKEI